MKDNKKSNPGVEKQPSREPVTPRTEEEKRDKRLDEAFEENVKRYRKTFEALS
jgi:hypothetical protein